MADRMCKGNYKGEIMTIKEKAECIVKDIKQELGTLWQRDSECRELCADYGESVVPSLQSVLRFLSLMGLDRSQPTEPGEIICNLYQRQSEN